ncbi:DUF2891 domain-containing protein [Tautonia marina]|uniref:DUF2891 domain-containing protein n=1 Tax=Tautonia marina TaxID=2653855 RepID=UPI0012605BB5
MPQAGFSDEPPVSLDRDRASAFARIALEAIVREYPNKPEHVLSGPDDLDAPRGLHPAFYGAYDWHSAVHGHWMLVRLLRQFPDLPEAATIRQTLGAHLTAENLQAEADYFDHPDRRSFERPYGWAWLLKLVEELDAWDDPDALIWRDHLRPLETVIVNRYLDYFPKQTYPIRTGVHPNTAFGLAFAHDYARALNNNRLRLLIEERARTYFDTDTDAPAHWEPSGADFFSPALMEADLMRRVLSTAEFRHWFSRFLPEVAQGEPEPLLQPAEVTDRSDPQLVHLDGLNLSRAWCMRSIARALAEDDPARDALRSSAEQHARAALDHVTSGDYVGEHWLASFAVFLLTETERE